jgi:membrane protein
MRGFIEIAGAAFRKWTLDKATRLGAAMAYYTAFAIAPLLVVAVSVAGLVLGEQAARGEVAEQIGDFVGEETAVFVQDMVERAQGGGAVTAAVIGFAVALIGASALFAHLRDAFNVVWDVPREETKGFVNMLLRRAIGVAVVLAIGVLLVAMMAASSVVASIEDVLSEEAAGAAPLFEVLNPLVTLVVSALVFTLLFRFLPATRVSWQEALAGGALTAVLYGIGSWVLSRYLGTGSVASGFGAASAFIVLLVFVYYSVLIVLYGAEFARVYGLARAGVDPVDAAVGVTRRRLPVESAAVGRAGAIPRPGGAGAGPAVVVALLVGILIGRRWAD